MRSPATRRSPQSAPDRRAERSERARSARRGARPADDRARWQSRRWQGRRALRCRRCGPRSTTPALQSPCTPPTRSRRWASRTRRWPTPVANRCARRAVQLRALPRGPRPDRPRSATGAHAIRTRLSLRRACPRELERQQRRARQHRGRERDACASRAHRRSRRAGRARARCRVEPSWHWRRPARDGARDAAAQALRAAPRHGIGSSGRGHRRCGVRAHAEIRHPGRPERMGARRRARIVGSAPAGARGARGAQRSGQDGAWDAGTRAARGEQRARRCPRDRAVRARGGERRHARSPGAAAHHVEAGGARSLPHGARPRASRSAVRRGGTRAAVYRARLRQHPRRSTPRH